MKRSSGIKQSLSPLTALAQRHGFAPCSLFTPEKTGGTWQIFLNCGAIVANKNQKVNYRFFF
jgi:hypothetical protein